MRPVARLTKLKRLHLSQTQVSDVSPLAKLTNLEYLDLIGTQVSDISPLAESTKLEMLFLNNTQVSHVMPLANLTKLKTLGLNDTQVAELSRQLRQLYAETQQNLYEGQMAFQPFLPHDDAPLVDRTDALALWCQGFLYGLSIGRGVAGQTSDDVREAIEDLAQIARAGVSDESDEDDEVAYVELVEFLRVSAQLIFEELNLAQSPPVPTSDTIH